MPAGLSPAARASGGGLLAGIRAFRRGLAGPAAGRARLRGAAAVLLGLGLLALALPSPAEAYSRIEPAGGDLAAGTTTTGEIAVGGELGRATRQTRQDVDWFRVSLTAGQTYTVDLLGSNATGCTLIDPVLQGVHDPDGQLVAGTSRGDGGTDLNSRLTFTPARSGVHYVAAAGAFESDYIGTGTYAVAVTAGSTSDDAALRSTGCSGVPSAPTGVTGLAGTGNLRVLVLWTASSDTTVTGYEVLRGRSVYDMTRIGTVTGRSTSQYNDSGAEWETTYVYGVRAVNASGVSARSETASVTTLQAPPPSARAEEGPNANDDAPRGPSTAARVTVDDGAKEGNLNGLVCIPDGTGYEHVPTIDYDWWKVDLVAGRTYRVELRGKSTGDGTAENFAIGGIFDPGVTYAWAGYSSGHFDYTNRGGTVSVTLAAMLPAVRLLAGALYILLSPQPNALYLLPFIVKVPVPLNLHAPAHLRLAGFFSVLDLHRHRSFASYQRMIPVRSLCLSGPMSAQQASPIQF